MTGEIYMFAGTACILAAAALLILALTWIRVRKRELRKQWEI